MMLRNRKKRTSGYISGIFAFALVLSLTVCFGYLWIEFRCESLGKELVKLEGTVEELRNKRIYEESRWEKMKSPGEIKKALQRFGLEMTWPGAAQITRLESRNVEMVVAERVREQRPQQYGARRIAMND